MNKFLAFLSNNFPKIKDKFKKEITKSGLKFDEDVFSDTMIKCSEKLENSECIDGKMIAYFWMAFKHNTLRELKYMRNKTTNKIPSDLIEESYDVYDEFNSISKMIIDEFGGDMYQLFALHANGTPYNELIKLSNDPKLKYKFRVIRDYIRKNYKWGE